MFGDDDAVDPQLKAHGYKCTEEKKHGDNTNHGHADWNDVLCALCDDGGKLLSCIGQCKRSFHPRKKDGRESKCKTLGYTSEELKIIGSYLCQNCQDKKHQCFKCGKLEPSDEPNAKVFKCKNSSCGLFYHPQCVAKLLEPDGSDGYENLELAKRIMGGMPFTCPVHWCFECGRMEDKTQKMLQFAVCRRCPKSYHRECLPRGISFGTKDKKVKQRAWELSNIIMIYCLDHKICKATGNAKRNHIKFQSKPKISKVSGLFKKKVDMTRKRKRTGDCSTKSVRVSHKLRSEQNKQHKRAAADSSFEHMVLKPKTPSTRLEKNMEIQPTVVVGLVAAGPRVLKASKGQAKHTRMPSCAVGCKSEKRGTSRPQKETSSWTLCNIAKKCNVSYEGMLDHSAQDISLKKPSLDIDAGLENKMCRIPKYKDGNKTEKSSKRHLRKIGSTNNVTFRERDNVEQNDVPRKLSLDKHAEGDRSKLNSREERIMVWAENADVCNLISEKAGDIDIRENQLCRRPNEQNSKSEGKVVKIASSKSVACNVGVAPDHVDVPPEKQLINRHVHRTTDKIDAQPDHGCDEDGEAFNRGNACQEDSSQCNGNSKVKGIDISGHQSSKIRELKRNATDVTNLELEKNTRCTEDKRENRYGDTNHQWTSKLHIALLQVREKYHLKLKELNYPDHSYRKSEDSSLHCDGENRVAETTECKTRQGTGSNRRDQLACSTEEESSNSPMGENYPDHGSRKSEDSSLPCDGENRAAETSECKTRHGTGSNRREQIACSTKEKSPNSPMGQNYPDHSSRKSEDSSLRCDGENRVGETSECKTRQGTGSSRREQLACSTKEKSSNSPVGQNFPDHSSRKSEDSSLRCDGENRVAETSECKTRQGTGSSRREQLACSTKEKSSNSPMGPIAKRKLMNHVTEGQRSYCDLYDQNPGNNNQYRYERQRRINYFRNDNNYYDSNRWGNMQPAFPPPYFGAERWKGQPSYPSGPAHSIQSPPFNMANPGDVTGMWHNLPSYPRRPEHAEYTTYQNNLSSINLGGYHAMGTYPASGCSTCVNSNGAYQPHIDFNVQGHVARYNGSTYDYGVRSSYTSGWEPRWTPAAGSVTDRYAPHLEQTNYQPRGRTMF